jgi:hypothetical protein
LQLASSLCDLSTWAFYRWNCMIWVDLPHQNWDDKVQERDYHLQLARHCHDRPVKIK